MRTILSIIIAFVFALSATANEQKKFDPDAYRTEIHKYIKCQAKLTCDEAKKFFAIFDEMRDKEREVFAKIRPYRQGNFPSNEADCRKAIMEYDKAELDLKKMQQAYHQKMLKVVPATKLIAALHAAAKFDRTKYREYNNTQKK